MMSIITLSLLLLLVVHFASSMALTCSNSTTISIKLDWSLIPETDLYYVAVVDSFATNRIVALQTTQLPPLLFDDLLPGRSYNFQLRSHDSTTPSIVQGWRNASAPTTLNVTCSTRSNASRQVRFIRRAEPNILHLHAIEIEWGTDLSFIPSDVVIKYKSCGVEDEAFRTRVLKVADPKYKTETHNLYYYEINGLEEGTCYEVGVGDGDAVRLRTLQEGVQWKEMWRSSENINEVDFLENHDTGDLKSEVAFLTATNDGSKQFFTFDKVPVSKYCVGHIKLNDEYAPYTSCNAPEAGSRNHPSNPICICQVFVDRLIGHEKKEVFNELCINATYYPNNTHSDPPCLCERDGVRSKYNIPQQSERYVGMTPVYLPYFYYQIPQSTYPTGTILGYDYSFPRNGSCPEGAPVGTQNPFCGLPCTWSRSQRVDVVYGSELLVGGWNATFEHFFPMHEFGPNITDQVVQNENVFKEVAPQKLSRYMTERCCGC